MPPRPVRRAYSHVPGGLPHESIHPGGVDAGEAAGGEDGGIALEDAETVLVDIEADVEGHHLAAGREGESDFIVGAVEAVEAERAFGPEAVLHLLLRDEFT